MSIYKYVEDQIKNYPTNTIDRDGRSFNQYETLRKISHYVESQYTSGKYDGLGRRKPFYNVNARLLNKQRTAEDIDTKDIELSTTRPDHYAKSLLMTVANKKWMKKVNFSKTLNQMTKNRGEHGGVLVKKVMDKGLLRIDVVDLTKVITDPTDIASGVKIDPQIYNVAELRAMAKNGWDNIDDVIMMNDYETADGIDQDEQSTDYITVYVVDGVLPRSYIDEDADDSEWTEQMHVVTLFGKEGEENGITLYKTERKENVYKYLPYEALSKRSLGRGIVEKSFEAQESINEAKINERNTMEIAGKVILQQRAGNSSSRNIYDSVDGTVLEYNEAPLSILQATPNSLGHNQNIVADWKGQVNDETSVLDANTGNMPASATFRGMALQNQEANSVFELRREEMDIFLKEIYTDWVIPFLKKWISSQDFLEAELSSEQMTKVLDDYTYKAARKSVDAKYFDGKYNKVPAGQKFIQMALDTEIEKERILQEMPKDKVWMKSKEGYLDGIEFDLDIVITGEQRDKQVFVSNKVDLLNSYLANAQMFAQDPNAMNMFNAIAETLGQSPLEIVKPAESEQVNTKPVEITQ